MSQGFARTTSDIDRKDGNYVKRTDDYPALNGYGYHLPDRIIKPSKMVQTPTAGVLFLWGCRDSREAAQGVQPLVAAKPPYWSAGKSSCAEIIPRQSAHARKGV